MLGVGDELAVRLFLLANAIAVGLYAMTVAGWNHRALVWGTFGLAFSLVLCALLWPQIETLFPVLTSVRIPSILWFAIITIAILVVMIREVFARKKLFVHIENIGKASSETGLVPRSLTKHQFQKAVFASTGARGPIVRFTSLKAQSSVGLFVDIAIYYSGGLMGGGHLWTEPKRIHLKNFVNVYKGQTISGEIFRKARWNEKEFWTFNSEDLPMPEHLLNAASDYRCRAVLIPSMNDEEEEYSYFYCRPVGIDEWPMVIGQHLFEHMHSWEGLGGEAEQDAEALLTHN